MHHLDTLTTLLIHNNPCKGTARRRLRKWRGEITLTAPGARPCFRTQATYPSQAAAEADMAGIIAEVKALDYTEFDYSPLELFYKGPGQAVAVPKENPAAQRAIMLGFAMAEGAKGENA